MAPHKRREACLLVLQGRRAPVMPLPGSLHQSLQQKSRGRQEKGGTLHSIQEATDPHSAP